MTILQATGLEKVFITNTIFTNINFSINAGQKVGLVGPNGAGKSTLMKCIAGLEDYDAGSISFAKGTSFGYLAQQVNLDLNKTLREVILEAFEDILFMKKFVIWSMPFPPKPMPTSKLNYCKSIKKSKPSMKNSTAIRWKATSKGLFSAWALRKATWNVWLKVSAVVNAPA